jgi:hypothetical protein
MTTKTKFEVEGPEVVVLNNGRYAYRAECPWEGKNGKKLTAFKFCSGENHREYVESQESKQISEESAESSESEHKESPEPANHDRPESPEP